MVSERDPAFTSSFWTEMFLLSGVTFCLSFHKRTASRRSPIAFSVSTSVAFPVIELRVGCGCPGLNSATIHRFRQLSAPCHSMWCTAVRR